MRLSAPRALVTTPRALVVTPRALVVALALLAAGHAIASLPQTDSPLDRRAALTHSQAAIDRPVGDHTFTAADGRRVRLSDYRGRPLVVSFVYTACYQICPTTTQFLAGAIRSARQALGPDSFAVATMGFNLPQDTPEAMRQFARQQDVALPGWDFLSPDMAGLDALLERFGFSYVATPKGFDHLLQISILDGNGRVHTQLYGDQFELPLLVEPLKALATGTPTPPLSDLGELLERVRLLCTVYDPAAGRYRLNYAIVIELLVGASILVAGAASVTYEWRKRARAERG